MSGDKGAFDAEISFAALNLILSFLEKLKLDTNEKKSEAIKELIEVATTCKVITDYKANPQEGKPPYEVLAAYAEIKLLCKEHESIMKHFSETTH